MSALPGPQGLRELARTALARTKGEIALTAHILRHPHAGTDLNIATAEQWLDRKLQQVRRFGMSAEVAEITPAMATVLLANNPNNRALVGNVVKRLADDMRAGCWQLNGEAVIVADTGELNDGQHRLTAVIEAGIPMRTIITFGAARETRRTTDTGAAKTPGHILGMSGIANGGAVASAIKVLLNLQAGAQVIQKRSISEIEAALMDNLDIMEGSAPAISAARRFKSSQGVFTALHYLMAKHDKARAALFFEMLDKGLGLTDPRDPVFRLRLRLEENVSAKAKLRRHEVAALIVKSWNAWVQGRKVQTIRWRSAGDGAEAFPQIVGG